MLNSFETIIFREVDETDDDRYVYVRISSSNWGVSIATFKHKPTEDTPEYEALTAFHFDPCFMDVSKIVAWNEHQDSENDDGEEIILVKSIDAWKPRDPSAQAFMDELITDADPLDASQEGNHD